MQRHKLLNLKNLDTKALKELVSVHKDKINTSLASFISYKNKLNLRLSEIHKAINKGLGDINESK